MCAECGPQAIKDWMHKSISGKYAKHEKIVWAISQFFFLGWSLQTKQQNMVSIYMVVTASVIRHDKKYQQFQAVQETK